MSIRWMSAKKRNRPTIGFLTHGLMDEYAALLWQGAMDAADEEGLNLLTCPGRDLGSTHEFEARANVVYDLIGPENVDGIVISGGPMSSFVGLEGYRKFCAQYAGLPLLKNMPRRHEDTKKKK